MDCKTNAKKPRRTYTRKRMTIVQTPAISDVGVRESDTENLETSMYGNAVEHNTPAICDKVVIESEKENLETSLDGNAVQNKPPAIRNKTFTEMEEDQIINFYSKNRFLWDCTDANYKIGVKSAALQDLVKQMESKFTAQEIHHRFSGMRTTYRNNLTKIKKSISTGAATDDVYVPTWPHFENMKFLDDTTPNRPSITSYNTQEFVDLSGTPDLFESVTGTSNIKNANIPSPKQQFKQSQPKPGKAFHKSKNVVKDQQADIVDECLEVLRSVKDIGNPQPQEKLKDRSDCYGQYVTASLKEMSQWNQTLAMADITGVLMKYDPNNPQ